MIGTFFCGCMKVGILYSPSCWKLSTNYQLALEMLLFIIHWTCSVGYFQLNCVSYTKLICHFQKEDNVSLPALQRLKDTHSVLQIISIWKPFHYIYMISMKYTINSWCFFYIWYDRRMTPLLPLRHLQVELMKYVPLVFPKNMFGYYDRYSIDAYTCNLWQYKSIFRLSNAVLENKLNSSRTLYKIPTVCFMYRKRWKGFLTVVFKIQY